jgi:hypothetical protein
MNALIRDRDTVLGTHRVAGSGYCSSPARETDLGEQTRPLGFSNMPLSAVREFRC